MEWSSPSVAGLIADLPSPRLQRLAIRASATLHAHSGALPDFIIVGAQKAGTTSLYAYLSEHPQVLPSRTKEIHYFDLNYSKGTDWYRRRFISLPDRDPRARQRLISGEASPYYLFHSLAASRIAETAPSAKLIALLRDPVARAYSHYQHNVRKGREPRPFSNAIADEIAGGTGPEDDVPDGDAARGGAHRHYSYLARGRYAEQLERFLLEFPRDQILILKSEDLFENPQLVLPQVLRFLGIQDWPSHHWTARNAGNYNRREIPQEPLLREYFDPHNRRLYELIGRNLRW